jgi:hypothetical protein
METETWASICGRLPISAENLDKIEGYSREGHRANVCYVERSFEIEAAPYEDVPLVNEEIHLNGHTGTFRVTSVNDLASRPAQNTQTRCLDRESSVEYCRFRRPEDHDNTADC